MSVIKADRERSEGNKGKDKKNIKNAIRISFDVDESSPKGNY